MLFQRGHILIRIGEKVDDFDSLIADHYFEKELSLVGEVVDSEGSEYKVITQDGDHFAIEFSVYGNLFEIEAGGEAGFEELTVKCSGIVATEDDTDVLQITSYDVLKVI